MGSRSRALKDGENIRYCRCPIPSTRSKWQRKHNYCTGSGVSETEKTKGRCTITPRRAPSVKERNRALAPSGAGKNAITRRHACGGARRQEQRGRQKHDGKGLDGQTNRHMAQQQNQDDSVSSASSLRSYCLWRKNLRCCLASIGRQGSPSSPRGGSGRRRPRRCPCRWVRSPGKCPWSVWL